MAPSPVRSFTEQKISTPGISDSSLLNSNNQSKFTGSADVVVAGAGIIGLLHAIHLKHISPDLKISVFEKSPAPTQKIGESILSSFTRLVVGEIIPQEYMLRLFGLKDGLQFYCLDEEGLKVTPGDIGGLDISFQLDRRVSELLLTMWAQRIGINVYHGVDVAFDLREEDGSGFAKTLYKWLPLSRSTTPILSVRESVIPLHNDQSSQSYLGADVANYMASWLPISRPSTPESGANSAIIHSASSLKNWLPTTRSPTPNSDKLFKAPAVTVTDSSGLLQNGPVNTKLVIDATGFARKLTSKFGKKNTFAGWNCDAYWAYFKEKEIKSIPETLEHWDYPATKHVCFPEGWGWFIKLISWHQAPLANLMDLIAYIIESAIYEVPVEDFPCTRELAAMFECSYEFITSIGWAVGNDTKFPEDIKTYGATEGVRKFNYFQRKYPTLDKLMTDNYQLLPKYYGERTFFVRKAMAYQSPVVAGEGWFAIGNSAGFTNPLISPGINAGVGTAWLASTLSASILSASSASSSAALMSSSIQKYQEYSHDYMMPHLHQMNCYWYNMFRDHRVFEVLVTCFWALGAADIETQYDDLFEEEDTKWLVGSGGDAFQAFCVQVLEVLAPDPSQELRKVGEVEIAQIQAMGQQVLESRSATYPRNKWGRYMRHYNDNLKKVEGKSKRDAGAKFSAVRCGGCDYWMFDYAKMCPVCGSKPTESSFLAG